MYEGVNKIQANGILDKINYYVRETRRSLRNDIVRLDLVSEIQEAATRLEIVMNGENNA